MVQIDGPKRRVKIKFVTSEQMNALLQKTAGQLDYRHDNGEISIVHIELVGMGTRRVWITNLPPEVTDLAIRNALSTYGDIKEIREETYSRAYKYPVSNGIRVATTWIKNTFRHIYPKQGYEPLYHRGTTTYMLWMQRGGPSIPRMSTSQTQGHTTASNIPTVLAGYFVTGNNTSTTFIGTTPTTDIQDVITVTTHKI
jgi:RNA recognition motif-containing protein